MCVCDPSFLDFIHSVNVSTGMKEERLMMTGVHTVSDIFCVVCGSPVGWKYVSFIAWLFSLIQINCKP